MKNNIKIKTSWEAITLKEFEQIDQIMHTDIPADYKAVNLLSVLSGEPVDLFEDMPLTMFRKLIPALNFVTLDPPQVKVRNKYEINGHKYRLYANITELTTAQYIDYQTYMKEEPVDLQKVISCFLIPEGHKYNDGYDIVEVLADIHDMKIVDVQAIGFFIQKQSGLFILTMRHYLYKQMKKMKIPKLKIEQDLLPLDNLALSLLSLKSVR